MMRNIIILSENSSIHGQISSFQFEMIGYNNHLSEISAYLLLEQLAHIDNIKKDLNKCCELYKANLSNIPQISMISKLDFNNNTSHKFVISAEKRNKLKDYLLLNGIETKIHYNYLLSDIDVLKDYPNKKDKLINAERFRNNLLSLPIYSSLSENEIIYIANIIKQFYQINN
jgi:dTDP-4-amino-4,6-dideoxygalactose transaminase